MTWLSVKKELPSIILLSIINVYLTYNFPAYKGLGVVFIIITSAVSVLAIAYVFAHADRLFAMIAPGWESTDEPIYLQIAGKFGRFGAYIFVSLAFMYYDVLHIGTVNYLYLYSYYLLFIYLFVRAALK